MQNADFIVLFLHKMACRGEESEEEYDFEYSDEEQEETDVDLENSYYAAKALKGQDPLAAVEAFREVRTSRGEFHERWNNLGEGVGGVGWGGDTSAFFQLGYFVREISINCVQ